MRNHRPMSALSFAFALLALSGCATQEVAADPDDYVIVGDVPRPNSAFLFVHFAPTAATPAELKAAQDTAAWDRRPAYGILFDGRLIASYGGGPPLHASTVEEGAGAYIGYLDSGQHHFRVQARSERAPIFEGDGQLVDGGTTRMLLYGPRDAVQARFVSLPESPPPGAARMTVANIAHGDRMIEVVRCTDATTCTPISGTLAPGDVFETDVPDVYAVCSYAPASTAMGPCFSSLGNDGAGVGYRLVPSASLPPPPVHPVSRVDLLTGSHPDGPPAIFFAAPIYMSDDGQLLREIPING